MPFYELMPEVKEALDNTWFDTAASGYLYDSRIFEQVTRLTGSGRILFGSDYPLVPQQRCLKDIEGLGLPPGDTLKITGLNAMNLLGKTDAGK
jgi:predicted TIM-barrel fold metal-dependent hydrolase